jgi:hypothetical protein
MTVRSRVSFLSFLSALVIAGFGSTAQAGMIEWTLADTILDDGGTLTGTFDFDPSGGFGAFNLTVSGGNTVDFTPLTFTGANAVAGSIGNVGSHPLLTFTLNDNSRVLGLAFSPNLSNSGTQTDIFTSPFNVSDKINSPIFLNRNIVSGTASGVAASPVPEPGSLALISLGTAGLFGVRKRRWAA